MFVPSKDGTRIPMFIVAHQNVTLDGNNPTYLYAYGGARVIKMLFLRGCRQGCYFAVIKESHGCLRRHPS